MLEIAICDDDSNFIHYLKEMLEKTGIDNAQVKYYEYNSGEQLIDSLKDNINYSLLILDIQMPGMDGNQVAYELRKKKRNTTLVFCSGVYQPTPESFKVFPYRYLLKQYSDEKMISELQEIVEYLERKEKTPFIEVLVDGSTVKLKLENVIYISVAKRGSVVHTYNTDLSLENERYLRSTKKVEELYGELSHYGFAYAHNSYIVNLRYVKIRSREEIELANGEILSVSRSKLPEFRKRMAEYLENE